MGSKNVPKEFQLCSVNVVGDRWLFCESPDFLVCVGVGGGFQDLCVVGAFDVKDFPEAL